MPVLLGALASRLPAVASIATYATSFTGSTSPLNSTTFTWQYGDLFVVVFAGQQDGAGTSCQVQGGPGGWVLLARAGATSGSGTTGSSELWAAFAPGNGSGVISVARGSGTYVWGAHIWQFRNARVGNTIGVADGSKTSTLTTRGDPGSSWVVGAVVDFNGTGSTPPTAWTPSANHTSRVALTNANYNVSMDDWSGQVAASTAYGVSAGLSTGGYAKVFAEILSLNGFFGNDDFARPDSSTIGPPWVEATTAGVNADWQVQNGHLAITEGVAAIGILTYDSSLGSPDMWARIRLAAYTTVSGDTNWGVALRATTPGTSGNCYTCEWTQNGAAYVIIRVAAGSPSTLATAPDVAAVVGDVLEGQVKGSIIRHVFNGVERLRVVDATYPTQPRPGAHIHVEGASDVIELANFQSGGYLFVPVATGLAGAGSTTNATSYATASVTPRAGTLVLIAFSHSTSSGAPADATGVTGTSISGAVQVASVVYGTTNKVSIWAALGTGTAGAITINFGSNTMQGANWSVVEVTNVDTTQGQNGVVQPASNTTASGTTYAAPALAAFRSVDNPIFQANSAAVAAAVTQPAGYVELHDVNYSTPAQCLETMWSAWAPTGAMAATGTTAASGAIAVEIAARTQAVLVSQPEPAANLPMMRASLR